MKAPRDPPFLARGSYRRRRIVDATRMLPFAGLFLFLLPVLWGDEGPVRTAWGGVYVFGAWLALILASTLLSYLLVRGTEDDGERDD